MNAQSKYGIYWSMLRHWSAMAAGHSYWHLAQGEGKQFVPGKLEGYFNDLTGKTSWKGHVDSRGLPLAILNDKLQYFPVTVLQKGLGHWDLWLESGRHNLAQLCQFDQIADWAFKTQDERGGWRVPETDGATMSAYSAMSQGQGISLLCRAYTVGGREEYLSAAVAAAKLMLTATAAGGTARFLSEGIVLEEVPLQQPNTVLNGWIFALYGLYDLVFVVHEERFRNALESTVHALTAFLPKFDAGFWSYYDRSSTLASPFYHRLHIAQLRIMQKSFPDLPPGFAATVDRFEDYGKHAGDRLRAVVAKGFQKLRNPPEAMVR
ncbi:MAG: D-glucuronyl C5-epimerase family protein [Acidobacteriia bacterium]|nr:D-glucuronyl C5-epimerase family protein [Terriglobia bacterium]